MTGVPSCRLPFAIKARLRGVSPSQFRRCPRNSVCDRRALTATMAHGHSNVGLRRGGCRRTQARAAWFWGRRGQAENTAGSCRKGSGHRDAPASHGKTNTTEGKVPAAGPTDTSDCAGRTQQHEGHDGSGVNCGDCTPTVNRVHREISRNVSWCLKSHLRTRGQTGVQTLTQHEPPLSLREREKARRGFRGSHLSPASRIPGLGAVGKGGQERTTNSPMQTRKPRCGQRTHDELTRPGEPTR